MKSFCRICEVGCGSVVSTADGVVSVKPDRDNPYSQGYFCKKGLRGAYVETDPDRLRHPLLRTQDKLRRATWNEALGEIGTRLRGVSEAHGPNAIAVFSGNSAAYSGHATLAISKLLRGLGSETIFSALSVDCISRYFVAAETFGLLYSVPVPMYSQVRGLAVIGSNATVNQWSPGGSTPGGGGVAQALLRRGGWLGVVDPQRHPIARMSNQYLRIAPGTNTVFLAALMNYICQHGFVDEPYVAAHCEGLSGIWDACRSVDIQDASAICGVSASDLSHFFQQVGENNAAVLDRGGVSMSRNSTVASGLALAINVSQGLIDVPHGFHLPDYSPVRGRAGRGRPDGMRYGKEWPSALLATSIASDGDRSATNPALPHVKALIVVAGNPLRSLPNTKRLRKAFTELELLVVIDLYPTETAEQADVVLPATSHYQRADFNFLSAMLTPERYQIWTDSITPIVDEERPEMWISTQIVAAFNGDHSDSAYSDFSDVLENKIQGSRQQWAGGFIEDPVIGSFLHDGFPTASGKMEFNRPWASQIQSALESETDADPDRFVLLGRRLPHGVNSFLHNVPEFAARGNPALISSDDAARLGLADGDPVHIQSDFGTADAVIRLDDEIPPRAVVFSHGWGHQALRRMSVASTSTGGNVNALTSDADLDAFTGMPIYHGFSVRLERRADDPQAAGAAR